MKIQMFAVYDVKAAMYHTPYFAVNVAVGARIFRGACINQQTTLAANPEDFNLFHIGSFDDQSGAVEGKPEFIINGAAVVQVQTTQEQ